MSMGDTIKKLRIDAHMTQEELGALLGVKKAAIHKYETGRVENIKRSSIQKMADIFGVSPGYLIGISTDEPSRIVSFPVLGDIAAGYDEIAIEDWSGETLDLPESMLRGRDKSDYFVLRVKGSSMYPMYIEGDKVLILRQPSLDRSGDIGVIMYIPEKEAPNKKALASALAMQMRAIVESDANEVDDIIAMEYQRLKTEPSAEQAELSKPLYPGDSAWVLECKPQRSYSTNCYDRFSHEWLIRNTGTQAWHRRKLVLTSRFKNGPAVSPHNIEIPDTEAGKDIKIAIDINAGGGEGRFELCWAMQDEDGNDCFPNNKHLFYVPIEIEFEAE